MIMAVRMRMSGGGRSRGTAVLLLWVFLRCCSGSSSGQWREASPPWAQYYGTKMRYEDVAGSGPGSSRALGGCQALQLNALIRHGTRYPTRKNVPAMKRVHRLIRERADRGLGLVRALADWHMWYDERMDGHLHPLGVTDMSGLAERLSRCFPEIFSPRRDWNRRLKFVSSSKHRCVNSTRAFIQALERLLEPGGRAQPGGRWEVDDTLLRFFDHCHRYIQSVDRNQTAMRQVQRFLQGPEMGAVIANMARKLGIGPENITTDMVQATFYLCTFEYVLKDVVSPWCDVFDKEDVEKLEYWGDLKHYWKRSYGHKINGLSSYNLFQDIFQHLDQAVEESERGEYISHTAVLRFGHAETLLPILTLMGYFKDKNPLLADNFAEQKNRKFRSGRISPFAANLIFVLYRCEKAQDLAEKYKLQLLLNEKPLPFLHNGDSVAGYGEVKSHYEHALEVRSFDNVCEDNILFIFIFFLLLLLLFSIYCKETNLVLQ
uniref:Multiple inositol polyphosphate phosphatase 1 n=1 Tax=Callorhinchus milii TaxID=7868 RepID=A0A4W3JT58_CALMI